MMFVIGLWAAAVAHATPTTVVHQGRLLDASGVGVQGSQGATFRLYPSQDAVVGTDVWEETGTLQLVDGYYTVVLDNDTPLDSALLASNLELWLEVDLDSAPLQRARLHAVPYALSADGARTLTRSGCNAGEVLQFDGAEWVCALNAGDGNGSFQSFFNTTSGWPGCASAQQKWTRIGDAIIYSVNCLGSSPRNTGRAGNITAPHSAVGTPTWARPSSTVAGSFAGATDRGCDAAGTNGQCHITDQATGRHWGQWVNQTGCCGQGAGTWCYSEATGDNSLNYGMCEHLYPNGDVGSSQGCADFRSISPPGSQVFRFAIRH